MSDVLAQFPDAARIPDRANPERTLWVIDGGAASPMGIELALDEVSNRAGIERATLARDYEFRFGPLAGVIDAGVLCHKAVTV